MEELPRAVRIIAPFDEAVTLTRNILFRPFVFEKWAVIGFAAFLVHARFPFFNFNGGRWKGSRHLHGQFHHLPVWFWPLLATAILLGLILGLLLMWISSRGRFVFLDNIVRNRGAIVAPWKEYRREGNSFFLFSLVLRIVLVLISIFALVPLIIYGVRHRSLDASAILLRVFPMVAFIIVLAVLLNALLSLVAPIMFRRRSGAVAAFQDLLGLMANNATSFILYFLALIGLGLAVSFLTLLFICLTCCLLGCLLAIPYVGSVIFLPVQMCLTAYQLLFLRQFGAKYDVWFTETRVAVPPPLPAAPPPISEQRSPYAPPGES